MKTMTKSSLGVRFDRENGCRRCYILDVPLDAERLCPHCAGVERHTLTEQDDATFDRLFGDAR